MESLVDYTLVVNEIRFANNRLSGDTFKLDPKIHRKIDVIDETKTAVTYIFEMVDSPEKRFPVDIVVSITGIFDISRLDSSSVDDFIKVQTCQILFPQIRSIIATLTSSALLPPLLLPIIDARRLFSDKIKDET